MLYIHHSICISPQFTFPEVNLEELVRSTDHKLYAKLIVNPDIPSAMLRRMGKAVKLAVSASGPLLKQYQNLEGIIVGTANGGMEDCIKFLNQIIQYEEGVLTPTNFVQSTPNAIAAQIGFLSKNKGYNITHVHRGLAFENALLDAFMQLDDNPGNTYLLAGIDEISDYNFNIEYLCGYIKKESVDNVHLYESNTHGSIAGEGVAAFVVNNNQKGAFSCVKALKMLHSTDKDEVEQAFKQFLSENFLDNESVDLLLSGENGDSRYLDYYRLMEAAVPGAAIGRYKHLSGEYQTSSAFAVWLADYVLRQQQIPELIVKQHSGGNTIQNIVIYTNYQGLQHSFILLSKV
ncbi:MAG: beta-ketoacyl synthase chain length factor [Bacteroidia bacterium]